MGSSAAGVVTPCQADPDRWFPEEGATAAEVEDTKSICYTLCSRKARLRCLEQGAAEEFGIWGGWDPSERAELLERRQGASA